MNNLRASIDVLFRKISPDRALGAFFDGVKSNNFYQTAWRDNSEKHQIFSHLPYYSHNEVNNVWQKIDDDWGKDRESGNPSDKASVFGLLYQFTKCTLLQNGNNLCVDYKDLLRWRELSHLVGEDLLTTCFLAQRDKVSGHRRSFFGWSPILTTNNARLKEMLRKGTAENHFHLGGSAPHSDISWIALMNSITDRKKQFAKFLSKGKLAPNSSYSENGKPTELYILTLKACYIRLLLFNKLNNIENQNLFSEATIKSVLMPASNAKSSLELLTLLPQMQRHVNSLRHLYGKEIDPEISFGTPDYCIPKNIDNDNINGNILLCGERKFLYDCFKSFFSESGKIKEYADLFYAYLIIKSQFREEMIQINENVGFANFSNYQDRKGVFLKDKNIYARAINNMAVNSSRKNQSIQSIEARIKPDSNYVKNIETINAIDEAINSECFSDANYSKVDSFLKNTERRKRVQEDVKYLSKSEIERQKKAIEYETDNFFYVTHFIKKPDKVKAGKGIKDSVFGMICRDSVSRKNTEQEAKALVILRNSLSIKANRIRGIDAASSELDCRPEAFAQAYRFIKYYRINGKYDNLRDKKDMPVLKATFHAGEDFYDIVDGMRAIDEAIKFLNLDDGDRIGHALALGINVRDFYMSKHRDLMLPKQWHLDNIVWLISRINKYNLYQFSGYVSLLQNQFHNLFNEIYGHIPEFTNMSTDLYYEAWKLRGDDPYLYKTAEYVAYNNTDFWQRCAVNERYPYESAERKKSVANKLYYHYHFDATAKKLGAEIKRFKIEPEYIKVVTEVQRKFQYEIAATHIGIETNPSSNYLIGTFKRYDKHPLMQFFNLGLESNHEKIDACPQLFVSINTDDQGVFNTYLENEYALMALALEKMVDQDGNKLYKPAMIYDWLDRIRQMGLEMSFK